MSAPTPDIAAGSIWRQVKLGTEAIYEVVVPGEETVEVIVRSAPGLAAGTRLRLTRSSVAAMQRVSEPDAPLDGTA
jgi:hypothetical protein